MPQNEMDFNRPMGVPPVGTVERAIGDLRVSHEAMTTMVQGLQEKYSEQASTLRYYEVALQRAEQGYDAVAGRLVRLEKENAELRQWLNDLSGRVPV